MRACVREGGNVMPIETAARELGVTPGTLRRWVRAGCPVTQRGRRGRGHALLLDPGAVRQWREANDGSAAILELASAIPEVLAEATWTAFTLVEGPHKRQAAGVLAATWYASASAVLDHLRQRCTSVSEIRALPESIERLRDIARG